MLLEVTTGCQLIRLFGVFIHGISKITGQQMCCYIWGTTSSEILLRMYRRMS